MREIRSVERERGEREPAGGRGREERERVTGPGEREGTHRRGRTEKKKERKKR